MLIGKMISIDELRQLKETRKTNLYYEEKEYLQYIFLNAISRYAENFTFKGGTCLRICYGLERASEDLDFNTNLSIGKIKEIFSRCLKEFELLGIEHEIYTEKMFEDNIRLEVRFKGPLFQGSSKSTNTLKVDFNKKAAKHKVVKVVQKLFSDVPLFSIVVMDENEIMAEKIRALLSRTEPRDLYDIWALLSKKVILDKPLIFSKLKEEKIKHGGLKFPKKEEYEIGLKNLLSILPSYEQVTREVSLALQPLFDSV